MKKAKKNDGKISLVRDDDGSDMPVLIKKYPNRRLYNTSTSAYIVLDDVVELVRDNVPFVIEDTKTGEDITRSILNQIIFEQETKPSNFHFPLEFQKQLIGMYGDTYGKMVPDYLTESLKLFAAERFGMRDAVESAVDRNTRAMMEYSQNLAKQNMEMIKRSMSLFNFPTASGYDSDTSQPESEAEKPKSEELEEIQKQIDTLQKRLKSLSE